MWTYNQTDYLAHHGIPGMKWGVRRYQDENGNYTAAGKKRYIADKTAGIKKDIDSFKPIRNGFKDKNGRTLLTKEDVAGSVQGLKALKAKQAEKLAEKWDKASATQKLKNTKVSNVSKDQVKSDADKAARQAKIKKAVKIGAVAAGTALAAYGTYNVSKLVSEKKVKPFTVDQLKSMGIDVFEPITFEPDRIKF